MSYNIFTIINRVIKRQFDNMKRQTIRFTKLLSRPYMVINRFVRNTIKTLTSPPSERGDYVQIGSMLFSKRSIFLVLTAIIMATFLVVSFLYPLLEGNLWIPKITLNSPKFYSYSGKARVVDNTGLTIYYGEIRGGNANGEGMQFDTEGKLIYSGSFAAGQYQGLGSMYKDGALVYAGQFSKNLYDGAGKLYAPNGIVIYDGEFRNGLYNGSGLEYYEASGNRAYDGSFLNGYREGKGIAYSKNGNEIIYIGSFSLGKYSGEGSLYENGKLVYNGSFADNVFFGEGTLYYTDSEKPKYIGQFSNGLPHGIGELYDPESYALVYSGSFSSGIRHGDGTLYDNLGYPIYSGAFKDGMIDYKSCVGTSIDNIRSAFGPESDMIPTDGKYLLTYKAHNAVFIIGETQDGVLLSETLVILPGTNFLNMSANMTKTDVFNLLGQSDFSLDYQPRSECVDAFASLNVGYEENTLLPGDKYLMNGYYIKVYYSADKDRIIALEMGV